jgi:hypothetical protein
MGDSPTGSRNVCDSDGIDDDSRACCCSFRCRGVAFWKRCRRGDTPRASELALVSALVVTVLPSPFGDGSLLLLRRGSDDDDSGGGLAMRGEEP